MTDHPSTLRSGMRRVEYPDGELGSWVVLGDVTDRSVRVWVREPDGQVDAALTVEGIEHARSEIRTSPAHDHVNATVLEIGEPRPGAEFTVTAAGVTRHGRFAPAPGARASFSFAFGSCHQPFTEPEEDTGTVARLGRHPVAGIYPQISKLLAARKASFALWLGDQVYSDAMSAVNVREQMSKDQSVSDEVLLEVYRHLHRGYFNEAGYRQLAESVPAYLMWDDHDIFDGWGSLLDRTDFDERLFRAAAGAYREYQHLRNPTGSLDAEVPFGYSFWVGDVGFHVPDLRGERDFEKGQILGEAGWALLDEFLAEAAKRDVPTIFIGLSVPIVHASPTLMKWLERLPTSSGRDVRDRWSVPTFAAQRTRLLDRLFAWQSAVSHRQVIVLSGDVHVGAAFAVRPRRGAGRLAQWTSSALSTPDGLQHVIANRVITSFVRLGEKELRVWRRGLATSNNVGLVEVEPNEDGGHVVTLTLHEYDAGNDRLSPALSDVARPA